MNIEIDGKIYELDVTGLKIKPEKVESSLSGNLKSGLEYRDIIGTRISHTITVRALKGKEVEFDSFVDKMTEPKNKHTVSLPYGQRVITYEAFAIIGEMELKSNYGINKYDPVTVQFRAIKPQRR